MRPILTITLFFIISCCTAQNGYKVHGIIDTLHNGRYLYLYGIDYSNVNPEIKDSCQIIKGQFHFEGKIVTPGLLVSLYMKTEKFTIFQFMLENRDITLTVQRPQGVNLLDNCKVENSPLTEQYKSWTLASYPFATSMHLTQMAIDSLQKSSAPDTLIAAQKVRYEDLKRQRLAADKKYIRANPGYYISLYWLRYSLADRLGKERDTLMQLYSSLTPEIKELYEARLLLEQLNILGALKPGLPAPAFSAPDENGKLVHLADLKGKYVLLDFWASWCAPCVAAIPEMKNIYALYKNKNLEILGVSLDDKQKAWKDALVKYKLPWMNISELKGWEGEIGKHYNIRSIPQNVLIGKDGKILGVDIDPAKDLSNLIK